MTINYVLAKKDGKWIVVLAHFGNSGIGEEETDIQAFANALKLGASSDLIVYTNSDTPTQEYQEAILAYENKVSDTVQAALQRFRDLLS